MGQNSEAKWRGNRCNNMLRDLVLAGFWPKSIDIMGLHHGCIDSSAVRRQLSRIVVLWIGNNIQQLAQKSKTYHLCFEFCYPVQIVEWIRIHHKNHGWINDTRIIRSFTSIIEKVIHWIASPNDSIFWTMFIVDDPWKLNFNRSSSSARSSAGISARLCRDPGPNHMLTRAARFGFGFGFGYGASHFSIPAFWVMWNGLGDWETIANLLVGLNGASVLWSLSCSLQTLIVPSLISKSEISFQTWIYIFNLRCLLSNSDIVSFPLNLQNLIIASLHHCIIASLHHCIITSLHHCIIASLHHETFHQPNGLKSKINLFSSLWIFALSFSFGFCQFARRRS
jgi:hypothetical protein